MVMGKLYQISSRKDSLVSVCLPVAFVVRYFRSSFRSSYFDAHYDLLGRRGWFPLVMHVHSSRTKMPSPDREDPLVLIEH